MDWQLIIVYLIVTIATAVTVVRLVRFFSAPAHKCQGCSGCPLGETVKRPASLRRRIDMIVREARK